MVELQSFSPCDFTSHTITVITIDSSGMATTIVQVGEGNPWAWDAVSEQEVKAPVPIKRSRGKGRRDKQWRKERMW